MKQLFVVALFILVAFASTNASAETPVLSASVAQGYSSTVKDGELFPGGVTTRYMFGATYPVNDLWSMTVSLGFSIPTTANMPAPRGSIGFGYKATQRIGIGLSATYQHTPSYAGADPADSLTGGPSVSYWLNPQFSIGLASGIGKTMNGGLWGILVAQPYLTVRFK